jgi:hypothetical protein
MELKTICNAQFVVERRHEWYAIKVNGCKIN